MKLVWTERAVADLEAIEDYIAIDNPTAALAMVERLLARAATLVDQPMKGRASRPLPAAAAMMATRTAGSMVSS